MPWAQFLGESREVMEQEGSRAEGVNLGSEDVKEADIPQWCAQLGKCEVMVLGPGVRA